MSVHDRDDVARFAEDHKLLSPNVLTSGQTWVGARASRSEAGRRATVCRLRALHASGGSSLEISAITRLGRELDAELAGALRRVRRGTADAALLAAFSVEQLEALVVTSRALFRDSKVTIVLVSLSDMAHLGPGSQRESLGLEGFSAISVRGGGSWCQVVAQATEAQLEVYVGVPWLVSLSTAPAG